MSSQTERTFFTAKMPYTEETLQRFTIMQFNLYRRRQKFLIQAAAFAMIVAGLLFGLKDWKGVLLALAGCVSLTNIFIVPKQIARQVISRFNGHLPVLEFRFYRDHLTVSASDMPVYYASLDRMEEDKEYLYLFLSAETGYLIPKAAIHGNGGYPALAELLEAGAGRRVHRYVSLTTASLRTILEELQILSK